MSQGCQGNETLWTPLSSIRSPVSFQGPEVHSDLHQAVGPQLHIPVGERFPGLGQGARQGSAFLEKILEKRHLSVWTNEG